MSARCGLVTIHTGRHLPLAELTWTNNRELYAKKHGYDAIAKTDNFKRTHLNANGHTLLGYEKIELLLQTLNENKHDILLWSGADTMITNFTIELPEFYYPGYSVILATDFNGINADSFIVFNTPDAKKWLQTLLDMESVYCNFPGVEQDAMRDIQEQFKNIVKIVPQRYLNAYHYHIYRTRANATSNMDAMGYSGNWQIGNFLIHCPGQPMEVRFELFNRIKDLVIK